MSEEKKSNNKSIEENIEESFPWKKSKKEKFHEDEDTKSTHKKSKKEKKKKDKKEKKHSKYTEKNETCEKNCDDNKVSDSVENINKIEAEVHTANNWEEVDLGNDQRKLKFLKLMGAFKHKSDKDVQHKHSRGSNHKLEEIKRIFIYKSKF